LNTTKLGHDTIAAISTAVGRAAIAVVRVSGPNALSLMEASCIGLPVPLPQRIPFLTEFFGVRGKAIDRVLVTWFPNPRSYTGEDLFEISCHGSPVLTSEVLQKVLEAGARPAEPGEFTKRAFLNGKLDLAQAEAVRDLIDSQTSFQAQIAAQQLEGSLSKKVQQWKVALVEIISQLETRVEFVEDDIEPDAPEEILKKLEETSEEILRIRDSFNVGRLLHDGMRVVISGKPNTGKSSIFNRLVRSHRAIVTHVAGTTRDAVTERISLGGVPTELVDTAGIRDSDSVIENMGVEKSREFLRDADLVLFVLDQSGVFDREDLETWQMFGSRPVVVVLNKGDLEVKIDLPAEIREKGRGIVGTSALEGWGVKELEEAILSSVASKGELDHERFFLTNIRHKNCLDRALDKLQAGSSGLRQGVSEEFVLYDLRKSLDCLGEITGETSVEDILDSIFSTFCIGK
jgi:tRNA modification GTPase